MSALVFVGRWILGLYFVYSGINHFLHHGQLTQYAAYKKVPAAGFAVLFSGLLLLYGGLTVLTGVSALPGAVALVIALLGFNFGLHNYWTVPDPQARQADQVNFLKNWALIGALLMIVAVHPTVWWL